MEQYLFPQLFEIKAEERAAIAVKYPAGTEQHPELVAILDEIRMAGKNLKQSEAVWKQFVPAFDQAQKWFSRKSEQHVSLPKGLTWSRIKVWIIDQLRLGISRRQFERRLRAFRDPGERITKRTAAAKSKKTTAKVLALADEIVVAYRAGQDVSAAIEAFESARSGEGVANEYPAMAAAVVSPIEKPPAAAGTGLFTAPVPPTRSELTPIVAISIETVPTHVPESAVAADPAVANFGSVVDAGPTAPATIDRPDTDAGFQPDSSASSSQPISPSRLHSKALNIPRVATPFPARSAAWLNAGSFNKQNLQIDPFKKVAPDTIQTFNSSSLNPFGDLCLRALSNSDSGDGFLEFNPDRLYELLDFTSAQRIFIGDTCDLFDDRVWTEVILEHFRVFAAVPWIFFTLLTANSHRFGQIQSMLTSHRMNWPRNLEVGLSVESVDNIEKKLKVFSLYRIEHKLISFLPFESRENHPISLKCPDMASFIERCGKPRTVVGGRIDRQSGSSSLSAADAFFLVNSAKAAGSKVFYCTESAKLAFERGAAQTQIINEINLDQTALKGTISSLSKYRELPAFRFAPVSNVTHFTRGYDSVQRFKPINLHISRFDLMCGTAAV